MREKTNGTLSLKKLMPLLVIAIVAIAGAVLLRDYLSFAALRDNREALLSWRDQNYLVAALVFVAIYIVIVAFSLPGAAVASLAGGFLFGIVNGAIFNIGAATVGATLIFLAARMGLGDFLSRKLENAEGIVGKIKKGLDENEISFLLLMRFVPAFPFFVANLVPALVGTRLSRFIWTTFVGIIPGGIVFTWVGAGLGEVFARGETPNLGIIFEWQILGPILALCALSVLPIILKLFRKKGA
ncbi:MAG: TVP38/TMEM64 family protein [Paracoccaceae bacterium]